ncbi:MAG: zinc metallopeptidase [Planctomycetales bacterium]|nr:zinc metallopeptidase [Planctomycetales bacterium]
MRWQSGRESANVEDRRSVGGPLIMGGGITSVIIVLLYVFLGGDPQALLQQGGNGPGAVAPGETDPAEDELAKFVSVVLADTEDVWDKLFQADGRTYQHPKLVLFHQSYPSGCGRGEASMGPFYCPADQKVYIDLTFYQEMKERFHAPGEFAQAYVIAHEVGHHVQNQLGISDKMRTMRERLSETQYNHLSVRLELQADFFAGVWAHHADRSRHILEPGDLEAALNAASAIGDDRLQRQSRGYVVPDSFTHGTSAQRVRWFRKGFETGDMRQGDTFNATDL